MFPCEPEEPLPPEAVYSEGMLALSGAGPLTIST